MRRRCRGKCAVAALRCGRRPRHAGSLRANRCGRGCGCVDEDRKHLRRLHWPEAVEHDDAVTAAKGERDHLDRGDEGLNGLPVRLARGGRGLDEPGAGADLRGAVHRLERAGLRVEQRAELNGALLGGKHRGLGAQHRAAGLGEIRVRRGAENGRAAVRVRRTNAAICRAERLACDQRCAEGCPSGVVAPRAAQRLGLAETVSAGLERPADAVSRQGGRGAVQADGVDRPVVGASGEGHCVREPPRSNCSVGAVGCKRPVRAHGARVRVCVRNRDRVGGGGSQRTGGASNHGVGHARKERVHGRDPVAAVARRGEARDQRRGATLLRGLAPAAGRLGEAVRAAAAGARDAGPVVVGARGAGGGALSRPERRAWRARQLPCRGDVAPAAHRVSHAVVEVVVGAAAGGGAQPGLDDGTAAGPAASDAGSPGRGRPVRHAADQLWVLDDTREVDVDAHAGPRRALAKRLAPDAVVSRSADVASLQGAARSRASPLRGRWRVDMQPPALHGRGRGAAW
mmetsp:Transcript_2988/g.12233  ORF Transcript_2988/g.12233 Transcript_2988/m.12233 type:complete len:514 (+) Transcript_2988:921-2462(+)